MSSALVLALLSKSSALPLLALVGVGFLFRRDTLKVRLRNIAFLAFLLLIVVGGTLLIRVVIQGQHELVPVWVASGLHVKNFAAAFYTFNPMEIIWHPFNQNWVDTERRQFLWEYCFKSVFFGEWEFRSFFRWQAISILVSAMFLLPVIFWGIVRSMWKRTRVDVQFLVFLLISLLALACFRFIHPNSSNQEIRYISFVFIPIAYFLARGIALLPRGRALIVLPSIIFVLSAWFEIFAAVGSR
jgi:4-amino-4-deoxy-L-arabinose transferase-like glycosyltransferase